uniref:Leishmanolysin-like peptidase n=1 Tax=Steinernema glaseri TaxID=37863 RepID=A0A1I7YGM7_9BILA
MRLMLVFLLPLLSATSASWTKLKIGLGHYETFYVCSFKKPLYEAIYNMGNRIMVNSAIKEHKIPKWSIEKCSERSESLESIEWLYKKNIVKTFTPSSGDLSLKDKPFNFVILMLTGGKECERLNHVLARASVCYFANQKKPILGYMKVCWKNVAWMNFESALDGYGLIIPSVPLNQEETRKWRDGRGRVQSFKVHGMDFTRRALSYARSHFNCPRLSMLEAEDKERKHLNEYIFGNELMTPSLNKGRHYFTMISALILEETFIGKMQWYKTVAKEIQRETDRYWYGRNWGCTFVEKSCSDYVEEQTMNRKPSFPFCTFHDYGRAKPREVSRDHPQAETNFSFALFNPHTLASY